MCLPQLRTKIWRVLKTSWLQLDKTMWFLYREVFLLPSEGVSSRNMFLSCLHKPAQLAGSHHSFARRYSLSKRSYWWIRACFSEEPQEKFSSSAAKLQLCWRCPQKKRGWLPGERQLPTSSEWRPYLHQQTAFEPLLADKAGGRGPLFYINKIFSGNVRMKYLWLLISGAAALSMSCVLHSEPHVKVFSVLLYIQYFVTDAHKETWYFWTISTHSHYFKAQCFLTNAGHQETEIKSKPLFPSPQETTRPAWHSIHAPAEGLQQLSSHNVRGNLSALISAHLREFQNALVRAFSSFDPNRIGDRCFSKRFQKSLLQSGCRGALVVPKALRGSSSVHCSLCPSVFTENHSHEFYIMFFLFCSQFPLRGSTLGRFPPSCSPADTHLVPTPREHHATTSAVSSASSVATLRHHFHLNSISPFLCPISGLSEPQTQTRAAWASAGHQ